ncbi:MAG: hypothetical protein EAZ19_11795 [Oscillatoriales cyanobacterium]|nr:MAG: hypothetical protein EAZ49_28135 [Oscillatoriales cyanobacterium]TAG03295.1 MAG: hypothetical protein EAZ45_10100 [Oscillatoriales cyanobacterium]TAG13870.1 MAG: hypothetical protein EAZ39_26695 [Oscillatoriales cyanobacterium]TAG41781.1 MAG: hypothetical protein EAZ33_16365 [Oscillatoriales cyanobacterium]TAG57028.1 MAG: hypothetical protein EAZ28_18665 [Oscillatoriales cyanobacterium]
MKKAFFIIVRASPLATIPGLASGDARTIKCKTEMLPKHSTVNPSFALFGQAVNCQLSTINCQLSTANCQLPTANCQLSTVNRQPSTVNRQLPTANCQLSTVKCH